MKKQIVNIYFSGPFITIFVLGILLLIPSILFENKITEFWRTFFHVVGIAFIAVAVSAPVSEYFQFKTLSKHMAILRGAQNSGIIHIFRSRNEDREDFQKAVEMEFSQCSKIMLAGVAFPRIFHNPPLPEPIDKKMFNPNIPIKILLLNPESNAAIERAKIEIGRNTITDIQRSIDSFQLILKERAKLLKINLSKKNNNFDILKTIKMEVHLYDFTPITFMIMTDNLLFLEQYHFGRLHIDRPGACIGGRTPLIQYNNHSLTYSIMENHFNYMWTSKSKNITLELLFST